MMIDETQRRPVVTVRLPIDLKTWFQNEASRNGGSLNSEIIRSLRAHMETEQPKRKTG